MAKACGKKGITVDLLKKAIDYSAARLAVIWLIAVGMVAAVAGLSLYDGMTTDKEVSVPAAESAKMAEKPAEPVQESATGLLAAPQKPTVDNAWISSLIQEKSAEIDGHRQKLLEILDCDTISAWDKNDAIYNYTYSSGLATSGIIYSAVRHFRNINELDVQYAVRSNPAWIRLTEEETEMQSWINDWRIKASRHSSDRPASPHDTVRDVPHPAQHR